MLAQRCSTSYVARVSSAAIFAFTLLAAVFGRLGTNLQKKPSLGIKPRPSIGGGKADATIRGMRLECRLKYLDTLKAMQNISGADVVIGANDGVSFDPASRWRYWENVPHHSKFFVEPSPPVFAKLRQNFAGMPNAVLLNRGIRGAGQAPRLVLHCWDMPKLEALSANYTRAVAPFVDHKPAGYWNACCSMDRQQLYRQVGLLPGQQGGSGDAYDERRREDVDRYIVQHDVATLTPGELIEQAGPARVVYVQVDVEGMDRQIVEALPFGRDGFRPKLILYEESTVDSALESLFSSHGYSACCCLDSQGTNIVVVPK